MNDSSRVRFDMKIQNSIFACSAMSDVTSFSIT